MTAHNKDFRAMSSKQRSKKDKEVEIAIEELLKAVEDDETGEELNSAAPLLRLFVSTNTSRTIVRGVNIREQKQLLLEGIKSMTKTQTRRFFAGLKNIVDRIIENQEYVPESSTRYEEDDDGDTEVIADPKSSDALVTFKIAAECAQIHFDQAVELHKPKKTQVQVVNEVFDLAQALHDILFHLSSCGSEAVSTQATISCLCENWWLSNGALRENLVLQALPLLVIASLAQKTDVKRLFQMRHALEIIDFGDPSSDSLRSVLLRIVSSPILLKMSEGKRFIAYLFHVDPILMGDVHQAIRVQIPDAKKSILDAYGDVYLRAWKEAPSDEIREAIETNVLTDLMYAVIHVADHNLSKSLMNILEPLHDSQKTPEVEGLLYRMYGPIIWRSLSAANAQVRMQATQVLAEVFPLQDPSHTQTEQAIRKGTTALRTLMQDKDARVRVAASEAVARILSMFWDVIPSSEIRPLVNHIVAEHASDASDSLVRVTALNSISILLENNKTHAVLRPLLPAMGNLIHDRVEKVRLATVQMLLRIKKTKGIKYFHVVPVDHLTVRLEEEGKRNPNSSVASALTYLMLNSYFPTGPKVTGVDQIRRTIAFLSSEPVAASVFYANLYNHMPVNAIAKLAAMLLQCLHSAVEVDQKRIEKRKTSTSKRRRTVNSEEDEEEDEIDDVNAVSAEDTSLMASLAETICTLWQSIEQDLDEESSQFLVEAFSGSILTTALNHFEKKASLASTDASIGASEKENCYRTCAAILRSAGRLPAKAVEGLVPHISSMLASLSVEGDIEGPRKNVSAHIALLCLWDMTDEVAPSLASSIEAAFEGDHELLFGSPEPKSRKRKPGASSKKKLLAVPALPPRVALDVLQDILRGLDPSSVAARESILESSTSRGVIEKALERGIRYAEKILSGDTSFCQSLQEKEIDYVLRVCEVYGRIALHGEAIGDKGIVLSSQANRLLQWTSTKVVGSLVNPGKAAPSSPFDDPDVSRISVERSILTSPLSPIPTGPTRRRPNRNATPGKVDDSSFATPSKGKADRAAQDVSQAFAVSLMQSSCFIFSEWLAVGGKGQSAIADSALEWCQVFELGGLDSEVKDDLLSGFARLATQLAKSSNFVLIEKLLCTNCNDGSSSLMKMVSSLAAVRGDGNERIVDGISKSVRNAAYFSLRTLAMKVENEVPESFDDLLPMKSPLVFEAVLSLAGNASTSVALAELLSRDVVDDSLDVNQRTFAARWLWLLCDENTCKASASVSKVVRKINVSSLEDENPLKGLVEEMLSSV